MTKHRKPAERRTQLLDAAVDCFARKGYHETTMDEIVRAANLSKGTLYWYFKSKRELFGSLMEVWYEDFLESMARVVSEDASPSEQLRMIMNALKQSAAARPELVRAQLEFYAFAVRDPEFSRWIREMYRGTIEMFTALIASGVASGEFRKLKPEAAARMLAAYMDGTLLQQEMLSEDAELAPTIDEMTETALDLLRDPSHGFAERSGDAGRKDAHIPG